MVRTIAPAFAATLLLAACAFPDRELAAQEPAPLPPAAPPRPAAASTPQPASLPAAQQERRKPFVVINFAGRPPQFEEPLYEALKGALAQSPGARFDLVAVTRDPDAGARNVGAVLDAMTGMGLPASRVSLAVAASVDLTADQVLIYVR